MRWNIMRLHTYMDQEPGSIRSHICTLIITLGMIRGSRWSANNWGHMLWIPFLYWYSQSYSRHSAEQEFSGWSYYVGGSIVIVIYEFDEAGFAGTGLWRHLILVWYMLNISYIKTNKVHKLYYPYPFQNDWYHRRWLCLSICCPSRLLLQQGVSAGRHRQVSIRFIVEWLPQSDVEPYHYMCMQISRAPWQACRCASPPLKATRRYDGQRRAS